MKKSPQGATAIVQKKEVRKSAPRRKLLSNGPSFVDIVDRYKQAVVNIEVEQERQTPPSMFSPWEIFGEPSRPRAVNIGTGFIFDEGGYILTNEHVIHGARTVKVRLLGKERLIPARIVGAHYEMDLAVLQIPISRGTSVLKLARADDIRVGEWVLAIGNPLGLDHSVTVGIISAKERPITIGDRHYPHLLQTDAAINRGNSGGPLINLQGEVVGVNTAVSQSSQGIGFAIAVDVVRDVLKRLRLPH